MRTNGDGKPVVALDIDGTLADYHSHFLWFAQLYLNKPMPLPETINPGMRLHKFMGVSLADYRAAKLAFRQGGVKRWMPVYEGAQLLSQRIRHSGAEVWICTTRPYLRLDNIDPDTREWLKRNGIRYDAVLFGEDKYRELWRQANHRVAAVLDDLPEQWGKALRTLRCASEDCVRPQVILRDQPYNQHVQAGLAGRAHDLEEAWEWIKIGLERWQSSAGPRASARQRPSSSARRG